MNSRAKLTPCQFQTDPLPICSICESKKASEWFCYPAAIQNNSVVITAIDATMTSTRTHPRFGLAEAKAGDTAVTLVLE
jgi:hypothetical protein